MPSADLDNLLARIDSILGHADKQLVDQQLKSLLEQSEADDPLSPATLCLLNEYAGWLRGVSRLTEAESYFQILLERIADCPGDQGVARANALVNIAGLRRLQGDPEGALALCDEAATLSEGKAHADVYLDAAILNARLLAYISAGNCEAALSCAHSLLENLQGNPETDDHELATAYNNLAALAMRAGKLEQAEQAADKALLIYQQMPEENIHHGSALATRGSIHLKKGEYTAALESFEQALPLIRRYFGENQEYAQAVKLRDLALRECEPFRKDER
ncbi:MAG: tetratricopeptide repeat protein [Coriobacteriales bacterium]|jgi:tetratricopeptide (TPR) repeat protein|nr:tetratricopeptide repeat protein [Coriobacteriales bacterium]